MPMFCVAGQGDPQLQVGTNYLHLYHLYKNVLETNNFNAPFSLNLCNVIWSSNKKNLVTTRDYHFKGYRLAWLYAVQLPVVLVAQPVWAGALG